MNRDERKEVDTLKQKVQEISEQQRMTRKIANVKYIAVCLLYTSDAADE